MRAAFVGPGVCGLGFGVAVLTNPRGDLASAPGSIVPVADTATGSHAEAAKLILRRPQEVR